MTGATNETYGRWLRLTGMPLFNNLAGDVHGDQRPPIVLLHGLTYDRRQWVPLLKALDPDRRVLALDLPGHGESTRRNSYRTHEVADVVHGAVSAAGLTRPILVGHSVGAVIATVYAARHPVAAVVNVDQPLLVGGFGTIVRQAEPVLRSPQWRQVWDGMLASMHIEQLPPEAQELVRTATDPRPDLLLGYWNELLELSAEQIAEQRVRDLGAIAALGLPYAFIAGNEPPAPYRQWLTEALPAVTISVMPGSGHFPHLAHPAELAAIVAGLR